MFEGRVLFPSSHRLALGLAARDSFLLFSSPLGLGKEFFLRMSIRGRTDSSRSGSTNKPHQYNQDHSSLQAHLRSSSNPRALKRTRICSWRRTFDHALSVGGVDHTSVRLHAHHDHRQKTRKQLTSVHIFARNRLSERWDHRAAPSTHTGPCSKSMRNPHWPMFKIDEESKTHCVYL